MADPLIDEIERFLALTGMKPTVFSVKATEGKDRHLVRSLRNGRKMWPATQERIRQYMTDFARATASNAREPASGE